MWIDGSAIRGDERRHEFARERVEEKGWSG